MKNIVSFKDLFDLSFVFMQNAFEIMTSLFTDASLSVRPWCSLQIKMPTSTMLAFLFKHIMDGLYLPVFQYIAAVYFVQ